MKKGEVYSVTVKPGSSDVVRSGPAGLLYAWVPLGGALLLASVVVAGGLRLTRVAWVMAAAGFVQLTVDVPGLVTCVNGGALVFVRTRGRRRRQ